ncbi:MAG: DoxX family protein [Candidatus Pelagibacterales bacterium]|nr:MAG: DoxX family protein [Pelagibacterales bacterium]|tara:strand:+ start:163 stop:537 length:375 start_codon:yes stop_codon:yes gene_type:complete
MGFFGSLIDLFGRIFISSLFIINGIGKIFNYESTVEFIESYNLPGIIIVPGIIIEILFPLLIIAGYKTRISAFILAIFTISLAFIFHFDFSDQMQTTAFLKNIAISGGLLFLITKEPGRFSLDK